MAYFAIYRTSDGELISDETDTSAQRATDPELASRGLTRVAIAGPFTPAFVWDKVTHQRVARTVPVDDQDKARSRERLRAIANKKGLLTPQERDELLCLKALLDLGDI